MAPCSFKTPGQPEARPVRPTTAIWLQALKKPEKKNKNKKKSIYTEKNLFTEGSLDTGY